jgi:DNA polymerase
MAWAVEDGPVYLWTPGDALAEAAFNLALSQCENPVYVAHNAAFELAIWNSVGTKKYAFQPQDAKDWICTSAMAYAMALPGSLAEAAPAAGLHIQKDTAGHRVMMKLSQPRDYANGLPVWWEKSEVPELFEKLYAYCKQDIEVERALFKRLFMLSEKEQAVWVLDRRINDRGVELDLKAAKTVIQMVEAEKRRLDEEMRRVTDRRVATCSAVSQLVEWLGLMGVKTSGVTKSNVGDLLSDPTLPDPCRRALLLRQEAAKSSTAKIEAMIRGVCPDGRLRGLFQYHGAGSTGRWAGRRLQPQNLPRPKLSQSEIDEVFELLARCS